MVLDLAAIKQLRAMTGAGMTDAKEALQQAKGDIDSAVEILRKSGAAKALKKASRAAGEGVIEAYVHGGRIGVLVEINCETDFVARTPDFKMFARDIALQVAAAQAEYILPADVPPAVIAKEEEIYRAELEREGKPAPVADKVVAGKLDKYYEQVCLVKQPFIKDPAKTVEQLTAELVAKLGENIVIRRLARFELGSHG